MPFQELSARPIPPLRRNRDGLPRPGVELLAVAELLPQGRTDKQAMLGVDSDVALVEECVHVRSQQKAVVEPVLASLWQWADVRSLQDRPDAVARDSAPPSIGVQDHSPEGLLTQPLRSKPWVAVDRPGKSPGLCEVDVDMVAQQAVKYVEEVLGMNRVGEVVGLALHHTRPRSRPAPALRCRP